MIITILVTVLLQQSPSLTPTVLNRPPDWNGWPAFEQGVDGMKDALETLEPKFGKLDGGAYQCVRARIGVALVAVLRTKLLVAPVIGRGVSPLQAMHSKIGDLERYFNSEVRRYCGGPGGDRATEALKLLQSHGYTPTALTRSGGAWNAIGNQPIFVLPADAPVSQIVTVSVALAVVWLFAPEATPILVLGAAR